MKKVLAVVAVVYVVCVAGAAFAQPNVRGNGRPMMPMQGQQFQNRGQFDGEMPGSQEMPCRFEGRGRHHGLGFVPGMPDEIRAKVVEAAKLRIDLEEILSRRPVDKDKAMEFFGKIQQAENEVETWKFANRLDMMEKAKIMRELNRISRPAKPEAPAPAK